MRADIYASLDCRIERGNLFEDLCSLLSKTAYPRAASSGRLTRLQKLSVEGFSSMLQVLDAACSAGAQPCTAYAEKVPVIRRLLRASARVGMNGAAKENGREGGGSEEGRVGLLLTRGGGESGTSGQNEEDGEEDWIDVWGIIEGRGWANITQVRGGKDMGSRQANVALGCLLEKQCKEILAVAVEHFNKVRPNERGVGMPAGETVEGCDLLDYGASLDGPLGHHAVEQRRQPLSHQSVPLQQKKAPRRRWNPWLSHCPTKHSTSQGADCRHVATRVALL